MKPDYDDALYQAAEEMFEFLAFLLVVPEEQPSPGDGEFVTVSVGFRGPMAGTLLLRISAETLPELGANMLGWAPDDALDRTLLLDALKELMGDAWTIVGFDFMDADHVNVMFRSGEELRIIRFRTGYDDKSKASVTMDYSEIHLI